MATPWGLMGPIGTPMGPHGVPCPPPPPWAPMGPHGSPWGPHGVPMVVFIIETFGVALSPIWPKSELYALWIPWWG